MKDLSSVLTRDEAIEEFTNIILPAVAEEYEQDGVIDTVARREEWNNWTDCLCKGGYISDWQYENWSQPDVCERDTPRSRRIVRSQSFVFIHPRY